MKDAAKRLSAVNEFYGSCFSLTGFIYTDCKHKSYLFVTFVRQDTKVKYYGGLGI